MNNKKMTNWPVAAGMASHLIPINERNGHIPAKERIMQPKSQRSTTFFLFIAVLIFTGFITGSSRAFASQEDPVEALNEKITLLKELRLKQQFPARMINTLNDALPQGSWLIRLDYFKGYISLEGFAPSNKLVADFMTKLKAAKGLFYNERFLGSTRISGTDGPKFLFRINFSCNETAQTKLPGKDRMDKAVLKALERGLVNKNEAKGMSEKIETMLADANLKVTQWTTTPALSPIKYGEYTRKVDVQGNFENLRMFFNNVARLEKYVVIYEIKSESQSLMEPDPTIKVVFKFSLFIGDKGE